jgi:hypothetical protein
MPIREYLDGHRFDPETTRAMGLAFEIACAALQLEGQNTPAKEALAKQVIDLAKQGERDPDRISEIILARAQPPPPRP